MKLNEILKENVAVGAVSGSAIGGFRGRLFGGPIDRSRIVNPKKVKKIKYSHKNNWNTKD
jgi:hypothetical protein